MSIYSDSELRDLGFASLGRNVRIDRRAALFGTDSIYLGSHVRIDCFAVVTAGPSVVQIDSFTHIAAHAYISGAQGGVHLGYGVGVSPFVAMYSAVEDYTSGSLVNPCVPVDLRTVSVGPVTIGRHAVIGSTSVLLHGVEIGEGAAVGALSLVSRRVRPFEVVHGNPIRRTGRRDQGKMLSLDAELRRRSLAEGVSLIARQPGEK
jgi:dTDP-4-amino-4,6-dideoxy-D-glucose acyltransferase